MKTLPCLQHRRPAAWMRGALAALAMALLASCGSGEEPLSVVNGAIVKGPVADATVCAYELLATGKGKQLGCTTTDQDGRYSLGLLYSGEVIIEATGGTYTDEGTGVRATLAVPLSVAGSMAPGTQMLVATPLTELAVRQALEAGTMTVAAFETAAAIVAARYGLPADMKIARELPIVAGAVNAYGDVLIGLSAKIGTSTSSQTSYFSAGAVFVSIGGGGCLKGGVYLDQTFEGEEVRFFVIRPSPSWVALLPDQGATVMGCRLALKSPSQINIGCPHSALASGFTLLGDGAITPVPAELPSSGVLLAGFRISSSTKRRVTGPVILDAGVVEAGSLMAIPGSGLGATSSPNVCVGGVLPFR